MKTKTITSIVFALTLLVFTPLFLGCEPEPKVSNLVIDPVRVTLGNSVRVSVDIESIRGTESTYAISIEVDGVPKETREVTLAALELKPIVFIVSTEELGVHDVTVKGLSGTFEVIKPEPLVIVTESIPPITPNVDYRHKMEASGGTPPYAWSWDLPEEIVESSGAVGLLEFTIKCGGISLSPTTGGIHGTLKCKLNYGGILTSLRLVRQVEIRVQDSQGATANKSYNLEFIKKK